MITTLTPELIRELSGFVNKAFLVVGGRIPNQENDDVYKRIRELKFPVKIIVMAGKTEKGMHCADNVFRFLMTAPTQAPKPVAWGVCAALLFLWLKKLDISVIVYGRDREGFAFAPGDGPDDVDITPTTELYLGNYATEEVQ